MKLELNLKCVLCKIVIKGLQKGVGLSEALMMKAAGRLCAKTIFLAPECRFVASKLIHAIVRKIQHGEKWNNICQSMHYCPTLDIETDMLECDLETETLGGPHPRTTILLPGDPPYLGPQGMSELTQLNHDELRQFAFPNPEPLLKLAVRVGLVGNSLECPCTPNERMSLIKYKGIDGYQWRCRSNTCHSVRSVRHGSIFNDSKLSLFQILELSRLWNVSPWIEYDMILQLSGVKEKNTIVAWFKTFRIVAQDWCMHNILAPTAKLGGQGTIVEIDESHFFKRKYNRGRMPDNDQWVFGMCQRGTRDVIMTVVDDRTAVTLLGAIQRHIEDGTTICSDGWASYQNIQNLQQGYDHKIVIHAENFVNPRDPEAHTQSIESQWSNFKWKLRKAHVRSQLLFPSYLYQYMMAFRLGKFNVYEEFMCEITRTYPVPQ